MIIIAEAGVNHNGSLEMAKRLVDAAAAAGADYVKFQTFKAEKLVTRYAQQAEYQKANAGDQGSQLAMLKKLELSADDHRVLIDYCNAKSIRFLSTAFDLESIDFLATLHLGLWKIPSGEITNYPYLRRIAAFNEPVILSTGMSIIPDIEAAIAALVANGLDREKITLLHCTTQYPTPMEEVNLRAMASMRELFGLPVGYSDHTPGIEVPIAATALGASVIEKHFTLDRNLPGPDHKASLEPAELRAMVSSVRNVEVALGSTEKQISPTEEANIKVARKSIVAKRAIRKGEILSEDNLDVKRPGTGLSPMLWNQIIGTCAIKDFEKDELITGPNLLA